MFSDGLPALSFLSRVMFVLVMDHIGCQRFSLPAKPLYAFPSADASAERCRELTTFTIFLLIFTIDLGQIFKGHARALSVTIMSDFEDDMDVDIDGPHPKSTIQFSSDNTGAKGKRIVADLPVEAEDNLPWSASYLLETLAR